MLTSLRRLRIEIEQTTACIEWADGQTPPDGGRQLIPTSWRLPEEISSLPTGETERCVKPTPAQRKKLRSDMSEMMVAFLWTVGILVALALWVPTLEAIRYLIRRIVRVAFRPAKSTRV